MGEGCARPSSPRPDPNSMNQDIRFRLRETLEALRRWRMPAWPDEGHEMICGTIGMGKSHWVLHKILQSFERDCPCAYFDPKGDTYRNLLALFATPGRGQRLYRQYQDRILFLNPVTPSGYMLGFNALAPVAAVAHAEIDQAALLANALTSHVRQLSGFELGEAMRMQNIMTAAIATLVTGDHHSLAELPLLFAPTYHREGGRRVADRLNPFVQSLLPKISHLGTHSFWADQWSSWTGNARREWVQSTEGRVFQYLFDERMLFTVCADQTSRLDFRRLVDDGYWLFVNLPYALLSETVTTVLGNLLISKIFQASLHRPPGGRPYRLILDEARFFNSGPLGTLLETSRAYQLWLTMVVQSLTQMARDRSGYLDQHLVETVLNNVRYWSVFRDPTDAALLGGLMFPLTGQKVVGTRRSGDPEYQPIQAEKQQNERRLMDLGHREVILWDKLTGSPQFWLTPPVRIKPIEGARLDEFEAEHLRATGVPVTEIRAEITARQARVRELLASGEPRQPPEARFGEEL